MFIFQWQRNNISFCYVIYRIIIAVTFFTAFVLSIVDLDNINKPAMLRAKWLIYLTNWHYTCCTFQSVLSAFMVTRMYRQVRQHGGKFKSLTIIRHRHTCQRIYVTHYNMTFKLQNTCSRHLSIIQCAMCYGH